MSAEHASREPPLGTDPAFADIPDPAAGIAAAPPPPPTLTERSPTRAERQRRRALVIAMSVAWVAGIAWLFGLRPDLARPATLVPLLLWLLAGAGALAAVLRPRHAGMPAPAPVAFAVSVGLPALFAAVALAWSGSGGGADDATVCWTSIRGCMAATALLAAGPVALAAFLLRRTFLSAPAVRGAAVGAVCGLAGAAGIHAHCPVAASSHVLLAHGLPVLGAALLGAALGVLRGRA